MSSVTGKSVTNLGISERSTSEKTRWKEDGVRYALLAPAILWLCLFLAVPLARVVGMSIWDDGITGKYYVEVFRDVTFYRTLWNTAKISFLTTVLCLVIGYPLAHLIATSPRRTANLLTMIVMLSFWTSLLVRTYAWMVILGQRGVVNEMLMYLGLTSSPLQLMYNIVGVMVGMVHVLLPFMIFSLLVVMKRIDNNLVLAAKGLGASGAMAFARIYLPLSRPGIISGCLVVFMISIGYYITPALLGGRSEMMLGQLIELQVTDTLNWGYASALSVSLLVLVLAAFFVYQRLAPVRPQRLG